MRNDQTNQSSEVAMGQEVIEVTTGAAAASLASKTTTAAGLVTAFCAWMGSSAGAAICGILIALAGLAVNVFFRWRDSVARRNAEARRAVWELELFELKRRRLSAGLPDIDLVLEEPDEADE